MGAIVTIIDLNLSRLRYLEEYLHERFTTLASNRRNIYEAVRRAEVLIGAVLIPGARAPILVSEEMITSIAPGSVVLDIAVDQGSCIETIRPTSHTHPTYVEHDVVHYGVPNVPAAVPRTSTLALCNATLPYVQTLARRGLAEALKSDPALARGVNTLGANWCTPRSPGPLAARPHRWTVSSPHDSARERKLMKRLLWPVILLGAMLLASSGCFLTDLVSRVVSPGDSEALIKVELPTPNRPTLYPTRTLQPTLAPTRTAAPGSRDSRPTVPARTHRGRYQCDGGGAGALCTGDGH